MLGARPDRAGGPLNKLHSRYHHPFVSAEGLGGGADQSSWIGRTDHSMVDGLSSVGSTLHSCWASIDVAGCPRAGMARSTGWYLSKCWKRLGKSASLCEVPLRSEEELSLWSCGKEFISGYFGVIDKVLTPGGVACIQVITIPESRFEKCTSLTLCGSSS